MNYNKFTNLRLLFKKSLHSHVSGKTLRIRGGDGKIVSTILQSGVKRAFSGNESGASSSNISWSVVEEIMSNNLSLLSRMFCWMEIAF